MCETVVSHVESDERACPSDMNAYLTETRALYIYGVQSNFRPRPLCDMQHNSILMRAYGCGLTILSLGVSICS